MGLILQRYPRWPLWTKTAEQRRGCRHRDLLTLCLWLLLLQVVSILYPGEPPSCSGSAMVAPEIQYLKRYVLLV